VVAALVSILLGFLPGQVDAQNLTFRPPQVERNGDVQTSVLFRSSDTVTIRWEESTEGLSFRIGLEPGEYGYKSIRMRGERSSQFTPEVVGLPVGVYYGVLTDSDAETYTEIQIDASSDPDIHYSREIRFAVESEQSPRIIGPRGSTPDRVPTFEWEAIPGVTAYALVVSNSPFTISSSGGQITDIEGLNPVWIHLTTETSARYGERAETNPLIQFAASALVPGRTYYFSILNAYSTTDPAFLSVVLGPIASFALENRGTLDPPFLTSPEEGVTLSTGQEVSLEWDPVPGALSYDVSVFERLQDDGFSSDLQIFAANTSNTSITLPAREVLRRGLYRWFVIANDREGAASVSETASFRYDTPMGRFTFETRASTDGEELIGATVAVRSTDGGYSPANPFVNRNGPTFSDSLSVGNYEFTASKDGYGDVTVAVAIRENERTQVPIFMPPLPSRIIGQVVDGENAPVQNATVSMTEIVSGEEFDASTSSNGVFSVDVIPGTFEIRVTKSGYRPAPVITVSVSEDQSLNLPDPIVIIDDEVAVSGRVVNQDGIAVPQARIRAVFADQIQETVTDGTGQWNLDLSEGTWDISASKEGFLAPLPREFSLRAGDVFSNINFVLIQQASRIEGSVQGVLIRPDGVQDVFPLADATVTAWPLAGEAVSTQTDSQGRFLLDLGTGAYRVSARAPGYDPNGTFDFVLEANQTIRDVRLRLQSWTSTVFGTVVDSQGERVDGAVIRTSAGGQTTSTGGGAFSLPVPSGRQTLSARHPDFIESDAVTVAPSADEQLTGVTLVLHRNAVRISGKAQTARGPVSGITVEAIQGSDRYETETGPDGSFSFQLPSGLWELTIVSDRYQLADPVVLPLRSGASANNINLSLVPDYVLMTGFVSSGGRPLEGVRMDLVDLDESIGRPVTLSTQTASDGSYALTIGALTRYQLQIQATGYQPFSHTFTSPIADQDIGFDAVLTPSISVLNGRVVRSNGSPLAGAMVEARIGLNTLFTTQSAFDGSFSMSVEAGSYQLVASAVGYETTSTPVQVAAGQQLDGLILPLTAETGNISLSVINPVGGTPVIGARLLLEGPVVRSAMTGETGSISVSNLPPGDYSASVEASGFQSTSRVVSIGARATTTETFILIPATGVVSGRVLDSASGSGLVDATVRLQGSGLDRRVTTDAQGQYRFIAVPIGTYSVEAQRSGYTLAPSVTAQVTAATPGFTASDIRLSQASGRIDGTVVSVPDQTPLSGVDIVVQSVNGTVSTRSRSDGTFTLAGLETATWTISGLLSGFRSAGAQVQVTSGQTSSINLLLSANQGRLSGRIRATGGDALPFDVSVEIIAAREQFQVFTTAQGDFEFEDLPVSEPFILRTRMQREGYVDVERSVTIPSSGNLDLGVIPITLNDATIVGNAGTGGATILVQEGPAQRSVSVTSATSTGSYEIANLPPATYTIVPSRPGYQFTPASRTVTVANGSVEEATFAANAAVGIVQVAVRRAAGEGVQGIQVRIASLDRSVDQLYTTDVNGLILPPSLPLGLRYRIEPITPGFQFDPDVIELDLVNTAQASLSFVVEEVNAFMSGTISEDGGAPIAGAQIVASRSINERFTTTSSADGTWSLGPVPGGDYHITASRSGFVDAERDVSLAANQTLQGIDLVLSPQSVRISGRVLQSGTPVSGLAVRLIRPVTLEVQTNNDGRFVFETVPIEVGQSTVAELAIARSGRSALTRTLTYDIDDVGTTLIVPDIVLSSGRIDVTVNDGVEALPDLRLDIQGPEGRVISLVTGSEGMVSTPADLDPGTYLVSPVNSFRLLPPDASRRVQVPHSEAAVQYELVLPYRHVPPVVVRSDEALQLSVSVPRGYPTSGIQFVAEFALNGDDLVALPMVLANGAYTASLPAPGELDVTYRIVGRDSSGNVAYQSSTYRFTPVVAGRLQNLVLQPDPHNSLLRTGTAYTVVLQVRDGLGEDLTATVFNEGSVQWSSQTGGVGIEPILSEERIGAILTPQRAGPLSLTVRVLLGTEILQASAVFAAGTAAVETISIASSTQRLRNFGGVLPLQVEGQTESGDRVLLGDAVTWRVFPASVAEVDIDGWVRTRDEHYIGPLTVVARDVESGLQDSLQVTLYAQLEGTRDRTLTDLAGTEILLPSQSIPFRAQFSLSYPRQPDPRRFDAARAGQPGTTAGSRVVRFSLQSDRSLLGDSLLVPARVSLAGDASLDLFEGTHSVGHFNAEDLSWTALGSEDVGVMVVTDQANRLGDYAIIAEAGELEIRHLSALPTPFSPEIAPLRVGYFLETPFPPATVRVDILTIRGELVRRLVPEEHQWPGRYGSSSSLREIHWDGLTDDGKRARNGRYLIRVSARDRSGSISKVIPVVLAK
jgi:hypothetical protein